MEYTGDREVRYDSDEEEERKTDFILNFNGINSISLSCIWAGLCFIYAKKREREMRKKTKRVR